MPYLLWLIGLAAAAYQLLALVACLRWLRRADPAPSHLPPVSILKPVHGLDPGFEEAIRSHADQDYPDFEILFGVSDPDDPAAAAIEALMKDYPHLPIRLIHCRGQAPNGKVAVLEDLAREARHAVLLVNDSDIRVPPAYLRRIAAPLADPGVGLVTCLYRASARHWPGRWEALAIATDFAPSVLVAPLVGVNEFGLGSTLLFRARDLERIGGFASIAGYLADDYQLARRITGLGLRVHLSRVVVETSLRGESCSQVWKHQLRWHRTIRVSRGGGYAGLPITQAALWALAALLAGEYALAALLLVSRMAAALVAGVAVLGCPLTLRYFPAIPLRDLSGVAVWAAGLFGGRVLWRDKIMRLDRQGRITSVEPSRPDAPAPGRGSM